VRQVRDRRLGWARLRQLAVRVLEPGQLTERTVRRHHGAGQLRDEPLHRLAHPPGGVPPEGHAAVGVVAVQRAQKAERPLLKEVEGIAGRRGSGPCHMPDALARRPPSSSHAVEASSSRAPPDPITTRCGFSASGFGIRITSTPSVSSAPTAFGSSPRGPRASAQTDQSRARSAVRSSRSGRNRAARARRGP
jgi:hypothetical protein